MAEEHTSNWPQTDDPKMPSGPHGDEPTKPETSAPDITTLGDGGISVEDRVVTPIIVETPQIDERQKLKHAAEQPGTIGRAGRGLWARS